MTFYWVRLAWPRLGGTLCGSVVAEIFATSRAGRANTWGPVKPVASPAVCPAGLADRGDAPAVTVLVRQEPIQYSSGRYGTLVFTTFYVGDFARGLLGTPRQAWPVANGDASRDHLAWRLTGGCARLCARPSATNDLQPIRGVRESGIVRFGMEYRHGRASAGRGLGS